MLRKTILHYFIKTLAVASLLPVLFFQSCSKKADINAYPIDSVSFVKVIHTSPSTSSINIAFDKDRLPYNYFDYTDYTEYIAVTNGINQFFVYPQGSGTILLQKPIDFKAKNYYSVFIADTASKLDAVAIMDSTGAPDPGTVKIRFANMCPDGGQLALFLSGSPTPVATNIEYKNASAFTTVPARAGMVFELKQVGQQEVLATFGNTADFNGRIYTIVAAGFKGLTTTGKLMLSSVWH